MNRTNRTDGRGQRSGHGADVALGSGGSQAWWPGLVLISAALLAVVLLRGTSFALANGAGPAGPPRPVLADTADGSCLPDAPILLSAPTSVAAADPTATVFWVDDSLFAANGGGFYVDVASGQIWTSALGWHDYVPTDAGTPQATTYGCLLPAGEVPVGPMQDQACPVATAPADPGAVTVGCPQPNPQDDPDLDVVRGPKKSLLVVSMGDSFGSGEGNPDTPKSGNTAALWNGHGNRNVAADEDRKCHRSGSAPAAVAATAFANQHLDTATVDFMSFACTGDSISGMLGRYTPLEDGPNDSFAINQKDLAIATLCPAGQSCRKIDYLVVSVGGNDLGFGDILMSCIVPGRYLVAGCDTPGSTGFEAFWDRKANLPGLYDRFQNEVIGAMQAKGIVIGQILLVEYGDPLTNSNGNMCGNSLGFGLDLTDGISPNEARWARESVVATLNQIGDQAASKWGWTRVKGVFDAYRGHGYCAPSGARWFNTNNDAKDVEGTLKAVDNKYLDWLVNNQASKGALHPNRAGQAATGNLIAGAMTYRAYSILDAPPPPAPAPSANPAGKSWKAQPGCAKDIAIGGGVTWAIGCNSQTGGYGIYKWTGSNWSPIDGGAVRIAVDSSGQPWVVNTSGDIYQRSGTSWIRLSGCAKDIGAGGGAVYVVGCLAETGGYGIYRWDGSNWAKVPGGAVRISVDGTGQPWVVNDRGVVYQRTNNNFVSRDGVCAKDIAVGGNATWVETCTSSYGGYTVSRLDGSSWKSIDGAGVSIAVDASGLPWLTNDQGAVYQRTQ